MPERELSAWVQYGQQRGGLRKRRLEMLVADLTRMVHGAMGGGDKSAPLSDYLMDPAQDEPEDEWREPTVEEAREAFGFSPRKKG